VREHRSTLVFVNTRRMAERAARHLSEILGQERVAAHHGSLARERRLDAEQRLKRGELKVLVATSSLELGIDIGDVDLVCQLGSAAQRSPPSCSASAAPATSVRRAAEGAAVPHHARRPGRMRRAAGWRSVAASWRR
jgi:superfamily II DNA/RNA helicase